jgi:aspartyl-tRNA(Asn)/glutamyl-tRNA(Gln) amidotransferase subunit B
MKYRPTIGMEVHAELKTKSKMFCGCANNSDEKNPNTNICPICSGQPGTLPVINKKAVEKTIKAGLALNCKIFKKAHFDRKNYFYPDLPKGYQISQFDEPFCENGYLEISAFGESDKTEQNSNLPADRQEFKKIKIRRIHLEEDAGKLIHQKEKNYSLADYNRAGVPLMELVTEPDISSSQEAKKFCQELQLIFRYLDISYADMEKGQMRCEVNVSISPKNENKLGTRTEIKNLNSFRAVERGIEYEIKRQAKVLDAGDKVVQETRGWDDARGITVSQRSKEEAHDYRYLPEPDLPPLHVGNSKSKILNSKQIQNSNYQNSKHDIINLDKIKSEIPELPQQKRERFNKQFKISPSNIETLVSNKYLSEYFEQAISELRFWIQAKKNISENNSEKLVKLAVNYIVTELQKLFYQTKSNVQNCKITPENFAEFITLIFEKKISSSAAQTVLAEMFETGSDPSRIIKKENLTQVSDEKLLNEKAEKIVKENPQAVEDFKKGKEKSLQFLVGKMMAATKGKANPQIAGEILKRKM